ncbi:glycine/betaine ABC transporter (plasmid) [Haloarcula hispanica N601]|uniref:Glycine/betaine ABC transporter n=2 Tax=Haloarcula hispanica TaxID=51589 RepID=V5TU03_HALHI|nr:BCCT family transporter [Haloarcula hispanica]AEM59325.1 glycine betaine transporter [Haloarcula hispanica ATCC 33960]AHB68180.1 glycine/betaine ABC transporter [Haloarcula hispanica N601]
MANSDEQTGEMSDGLQVELFHPESDREPGDTNIQAAGFDIHPVVFPVALAIIALFIAVTILLGDTAASAYTWLFNTIGDTFGWFYLLAVNVFIITLLYFAFSKYGNIRIGGVEAEKEFSDFSWMAMLFSAGMGIGLMFFSVSEPLYYFQNPPSFFGAEAGTGAAASAAMAQTFFHWGFHPWAVYGLVGLGLAFFSFNRGLPLTFRSIFWPLLGERIYGWPGHIIDLVTVFATLFGLSTSLGLGVAQVNTGLSYVGGDMLGAVSVPTGTWPQVALIAGITLIATLSVAAGLDGGVKRLSTLNLYLMFALLGFLVIVGPTVYIFGTWAEGLGAYFGNILALGFFTGTLNEAANGTPTAWTVFYWGWWIAWSPFVGMFIARISKGRSVREFVLGVLFLPSMFSTLWLSVFGGSAMFNSLLGNGQALATYNEVGQTVAMFALLEQFPLGVVSGLIATLLVITFFVTSSDSGSLVIDHLTSGGKHDVPRTQRIFWALTEGLVASILLIGGGLTALQTAAITTGLPFAFILCLMCYTVYLGLDNEYQILESEEFAETIQDLSERDDVDVVTAGDEMVTDISDPGDDTATGTD